MRRGAEVGCDARCCVKVATRRLLEVQLVVVAILWSGKKSDAMWHGPQRSVLLLLLLFTLTHHGSHSLYTSGALP